MEMETTSEQNQKHIAAVNQEQEQVKELLRRGSVRHYFLGPENVWSREGFGIVVGGALAVLFGALILPKIFLHSNNSETLKIICWIMTAAGVVLLGKGLYEMYKESRMECKTVPDGVHDEILAYDIVCLKKTSLDKLMEHIPKPESGERFDQMEMVLVKGPRDYSANVNLPLVWRRGDDGTLRYSNFSVMALYFGTKTLYIYTCIYNMRNGSARFHHTYECPYEQIRFAGFENRTVETVTQNNKSVMQNLKMLVIDAGDGENETLSMPVADYDVMKQMNGTIDLREAEEAVRMLADRIEGVKLN